eukprot:358722-Chlamydomonas_euryale.AAC.6
MAPTSAAGGSARRADGCLCREMPPPCVPGPDGAVTKSSISISWGPLCFVAASAAPPLSPAGAGAAAGAEDEGSISTSAACLPACRYGSSEPGALPVRCSCTSASDSGRRSAAAGATADASPRAAWSAWSPWSPMPSGCAWGCMGVGRGSTLVRWSMPGPARRAPVASPPSLVAARRSRRAAPLALRIDSAGAA